MLLTSIAHAERVLKFWSDIPWLAQDTETQAKAQWPDKESTLIHYRHVIKIFSFCYKGVSYSCPTNLISPQFPTIEQWAELFEWYFCELNPKVESVFHNANYDIRVMRHQGWPVFRRVWDTMISSWMANANVDKGLKSRAPFYGRHIRDTKTINFNDLQELSSYAEDDVVVTDEIYQMHTRGVVIRPKTLYYLNQDGKFTAPVPNPVGDFRLTIPTEVLSPFDRLFLRKQEFPVLISTIECEKNGVPLNAQKLVGIRAQMTKELAAVTKRIYRHAGKKINLNAAQQKVAVLQDLGLNLTRKTKAGKFSADFESMVGLRGQHPIVDDFIEYAKVEKLRSVYIGEKKGEGLEYYLNPKTQCIHPSLNTVGAVTGRFSSSSPNMQNIPSRYDRYKLKDCFEAPKGQSLICMDYSQIELRVMALFSKDPLMTKVLNDPKGDIHQTTAENMDVPRDPVAKQCNFLLIFGGGGRVLAQRLRLEGHAISDDEGFALVDGFNETYTHVKPYRESQFDFHRQHGFVYLITGRRRVIENIDSSNRYELHMAETQLANNQIQGSAQDFMKALIVRCSIHRPNMDAQMHKFLDMPRDHELILRDYARKVEKFRRAFKLAKLRWRLQVHDEVLHTCDKHAAIDCAHHISEMMTWRHYFPPVTPMTVALRGDGGVGQTWGQAKKPTDPALKIHSPTVLL